MVGPLKDIKTSLTAQGAEELFVTLIAVLKTFQLAVPITFVCCRITLLHFCCATYLQLQTKRTKDANIGLECILNTWWLVPREIVNFVSWESHCLTTLRFQVTKLTVSWKTSVQVICYIAENSLKTLNLGAMNGSSRWTFVGNSALLPSDVKDFCNVACSEILMGNSFIVRCHVTSK